MSASLSKWNRVSRKRPCEVCRKPDWCTWSDDGANCCMRVQSDTPMRNGGWLHRDQVQSYVAPIRKAIPDAAVNFEKIWQPWFNSTTYQDIDGLGMSLGVDPESLQSLDCAWNGSAWAFPMRDAEDRMIGIRLRDNKGNKWAVKGSKQGLFLSYRRPEGTLFIVEGPTDCAAALTLGLSAIGRPSCLGQEDLIVKYIRLHSIKRTIVITDNDDAGLRGAVKLQSLLPIPSTRYVPPVKDLRQLVQLGGDANMIHTAVKDLVWQMPTI